MEQDAIVGMCLGMSGVDREADANVWKASLEGWLSKEARTACLKQWEALLMESVLHHSYNGLSMHAAPAVLCNMM